MPIITLPDGSQRSFPAAITALQVANTIGTGLAKAAVAAKFNGRLVDISFTIEEDGLLHILTERDSESLAIIRHSTAHLLAHAVKSLYPSAQVTIGPVIEEGFYYDFAYERPFTPDDLEAIEAKMRELAQQNLSISRQVMEREQAIAFFRGLGEEYKAKIIENIPVEQELSLYQQGDFIDLCRGPHVRNTSQLKAFKLTKLAGAYWRGNSDNEMLQRIYGTAWPDQKSLQAYLTRLEEAEKRDHRRLAKQLDLFHIQDEAPGMIFWHAAGWTIYQVIEQYLREQLRLNGYQEVRTPQILDRSLWEKTGHWQNYREEMFVTSSENRDFAIKPMNCPCHVQIFKQGLHSYRDLPIKFAEFGSCHRNELSGALHGLMRVRNFVQDDGHIFCTEEQIQGEVSQLIDMVFKIYDDFGFNEIQCRLSTRPDKRVGSDEIWDKAEQALQAALEQKELAWQLCAGEGAFYGPKIDFALKDCIGRVWQCGTIQLDFSIPMRLGAQYITEEGSKQTPVMIHRAIIGSLERFIGVLIEHYAGKFPVWLAPQQVVVLNITDNQANYAGRIVKELQNAGFRAHADLRNEKIGFKIRQHTLSRVPYLLVIGERELATQTITVRTRKGDDLGNMLLEAFIERLQADNACRGRVINEEE